MQKYHHQIRTDKIRGKHPGFILFLLLFAGVSAYSQDFKGSLYDKRVISLNPAIVFSGDGDAFGFGSEVTHLKTIGKHFYLKQNLASWVVNGSSWIEGAFENQTGMDLSAELGFAPFKMDKRIFSISAGICGAYYMNTSPTSGGTWGYYNSGTGEHAYVNSYNQGYEKGFDVGIIFGINYYSQISPLLYLNARADFRSHMVQGSAISMISVGIGFDMNELFK